MREILIELIDAFFEKADVKEWYSEELDEHLADHLLANGVIAPPCKVGDTLYAITYDRSRIVASEVRNLSQLVRLIEDECFGEWVFTTEAEAEKALKERSGG